MYKKILSISATMLCAFSASAESNTHLNHHQPKTNQAISHAPIAVMGDHLHQKGEFMLSYRYMDMDMQGLQQGTQSVDSQEVLNSFMMVPKNMQMKMHMLGVMYAPTDDITLMLMTNYLENNMQSMMTMSNMNDMNDMNDMNGGMMNADMEGMAQTQHMTFSTMSSGLGDSRFGALIRGYQAKNYHSHYTVGLNLPTGDIDQQAKTPMNDNALLGYPMQLGTQTWNVYVGYTGVYHLDNIQLGGQYNYEIALTENSQDYKPGNQSKLHTWAAYAISNELSVSARATYSTKNNIKGVDQRLNSMMMPTANPNMYAKRTWEAALGLNYAFNNPMLNGHRLALEWVEPIAQDVSGIQMKQTSSLVLGWQFAF